MSSFVFPTSEELFLIEQDKLARLQKDRLCFDFFGLEEKDAHLVAFEQRDNYAGLQQLRGLGGEPARVQAIGGRRYQYEPGVYGEVMFLDEVELTSRRAWGQLGAPINITDLVLEKSEQLQTRFLDRVELTAWLAVQGTFAVSAQGRLVHQDAFNVQTYTASVTWIANPATATPIANFRDIQLLSRGRSTSFGSDAKAYMNRQTFNGLIANTNAADLYGKRTAGLANVMTLEQVNAVLAGEGLPMIVIYDEGYLPDPTPGSPALAASFIPFIPLSKVIVIGKRPGNAKVGSYLMTRNLNNPGLKPGQYTRVIDRGELQIPRSIEVHNGHNGGPTIYYPGAVVVMSV